MAWQEPKTDWVQNPKNPKSEDFNRIEGNIEFLKQDIETKKGEIVVALNSVGISASINDTHAQIANKIILAEKKGVVITPGATDKLIPAGIYHDEGYVAGDPDLVASNIKSGVNIFGVNGDSNVVDTSGGDAVASDIVKGKKAYAKGSLVTGSLELTGNATAAQVLDKQTFYSSDPKTKQTGTMPNRGAVTITPKATDQVISSGYHNGNGKVVGDANLIPANIVEGKNIFGIPGSVKKIDYNLLEVARNIVNSDTSVMIGIDTSNNQIIVLSGFGYYSANIQKKIYNSSGTLLSTVSLLNIPDYNHNRRYLRTISNNEFCTSRYDTNDNEFKWERYNLSGTLITSADRVVGVSRSYLCWVWRNGSALFYWYGTLNSNEIGRITTFNKAGTQLAMKEDVNYFNNTVFIITEGSNEYIYFDQYEVLNGTIVDKRNNMFSSFYSYISSYFSK